MFLTVPSLIQFLFFCLFMFVFHIFFETRKYCRLSDFDRYLPVTGLLFKYSSTLAFGNIGILLSVPGLLFQSFLFPLTHLLSHCTELVLTVFCLGDCHPDALEHTRMLSLHISSHRIVHIFPLPRLSLAIMILMNNLF